MYDLKIGQDCERAFTDKVVTTNTTRIIINKQYYELFTHGTCSCKRPVPSLENMESTLDRYGSRKCILGFV